MTIPNHTIVKITSAPHSTLSMIVKFLRPKIYIQIMQSLQEKALHMSAMKGLRKKSWPELQFRSRLQNLKKITLVSESIW